MASQETTVVKGNGGGQRGGFFGGLLKAFIPMAASSLGGPYAGAAAKAGMGFLSGDAKQAAEGGADLIGTTVSGGEEPPPEDKEPVIPDDEGPSTPQQTSPSPEQQAQIPVPEVPYTPEQMQEQELAFRFLEQQAPNIPVFLSQTPEIFPALKGFVSQMESRYKR